MTQVVRYAFEKELDNHDQMRPVASSYLSKRECGFRNVSVMSCLNSG